MYLKNLDSHSTVMLLLSLPTHQLQFPFWFLKHQSVFTSVIHFCQVRNLLERGTVPFKELFNGPETLWEFEQEIITHFKGQRLDLKMEPLTVSGSRRLYRVSLRSQHFNSGKRCQYSVLLNFEGVWNRPLQDGPLWYVNYLELKAIKTLWSQETFLPLPLKNLNWEPCS